MMRRGWIAIIVMFVVSVNAFSFTHNLMKVLNLLKKISSGMAEYSDLMQDHYTDFIEFYRRRWAQCYTKFSGEETAIFEGMETEKIYEGPEVDHEKLVTMWRIIFSNPGRISELFPNLFYTDHLTADQRYVSDPGYRLNTDKNISDGAEYMERVESLILLLKNTRESQKIRGRKAAELRKYIGNFSMPKGHDEVRMGRLTGIEVIIDHEIEKQYVELISLLNARTEIGIRSSSMAENMGNRNYRFRLGNPETKKGSGK